MHCVGLAYERWQDRYLVCLVLEALIICFGNNILWGAWRAPGASGEWPV